MADALEDARKRCDAAIKEVTRAGVHAAQGESATAAVSMLRALGHLHVLRRALASSTPEAPPQRQRRYTREQVQEQVRRRLAGLPATVALEEEQKRRAAALAAAVRAREERAQRKTAKAMLRAQVEQLKAANKGRATKLT
jgi:hypothetical protein